MSTDPDPQTCLEKGDFQNLIIINMHVRKRAVKPFAHKITSLA